MCSCLFLFGSECILSKYMHTQLRQKLFTSLTDLDLKLISFSRGLYPDKKKGTSQKIVKQLKRIITMTNVIYVFIYIYSERHVKNLYSDQ